MLGCASTSLALAFVLARGAGPAPAPVRVDPAARAPKQDHVRRPAPPPTARSARPLDPAALHARMQAPRSDDLRNPFERLDGAAMPVDTTPPRDLKDPFAHRRPTPPATVPVTISPDLHNPFASRMAKPKPAPARSERPSPPPTAACTTAKGVPVQRPRAVRSSAPPCPAPERPVAPRPGH